MPFYGIYSAGYPRVLYPARYHLRIHHHAAPPGIIIGLLRKNAG
jgi:hypothetical protein